MASANPDWDAMLDRWEVLGIDYVDEAPSSWPALMGEISFDARQRWPDGRLILTSLLLTPIDELAPGVIARTRNNRYLLGARYGAPPD